MAALSGPREVETLGSGSSPLDGSRILPTQTINCSIAAAYPQYNHEL